MLLNFSSSSHLRLLSSGQEAWGSRISSKDRTGERRYRWRGRVVVTPRGLECGSLDVWGTKVVMIPSRLVTVCTGRACISCLFHETIQTHNFRSLRPTARSEVSAVHNVHVAPTWLTFDVIRVTPSFTTDIAHLHYYSLPRDFARHPFFLFCAI